MHKTAAPQSPTDACAPEQAARKLSRLEIAIVEVRSLKRELDEAKAEAEAADLLRDRTAERYHGKRRELCMAEERLAVVAGEEGLEGLTRG